MSEHLDPLALDALRAGGGSPAEREHAARCPECAAAVEGLRDLAARLAGPRVEVPEAVRRSILAEARRRMRPARSRAPLWIAAAAVLAAFAGVWLSLPPAGDVDRSGAVDILDAYTLAVRIKSGDRLDPRWDLNRDGVVDRRDVDAIGMMCVSVPRRRGG